MSSEITEVIPLGPDDLMESPVQTMWKWHLKNGLDFQPADTLEPSFIHRKLAIAMFHKEHVSEKTLKNNLFNRVRVHKHNKDLVLYGDLLKFRGDKAEDDEEKEEA